MGNQRQSKRGSILVSRNTIPWWACSPSAVWKNRPGAARLHTKILGGRAGVHTEQKMEFREKIDQQLKVTLLCPQRPGFALVRCLRRHLCTHRQAHAQKKATAASLREPEMQRRRYRSGLQISKRSWGLRRGMAGAR